MNFKTTLFLAAAFIGVLGGYFVFRPDPSATPEAEAAVDAPSLEQKLIDEELSDVVKVVCRKKDGPEWVFESAKDEAAGARATWRMTAPVDMAVKSYDVERFGRDLKRIKYEVSYGPGDSGAPSPREAGLDPPVATITLTDQDGKTVTVEIGKERASRKTYVRRAGSDRICVAKMGLATIIKEKLLDYRDQQVWKFDAADVTRIEIEDRRDTANPISYVFAKDGAEWLMEAPASARATDKVQKMVSEIARLRAIKWHDDRNERLPMYGLEPATLTVRATVVETIEPEEEESEDAAESEGDDPPADAGEETQDTESQEPEAPREVTTIHVLHLSDRGPIGKSSQTYFRTGDGSIVGTLSKVSADRIHPDMSKWRDMDVVATKVTRANRIEIVRPDRTTILARDKGRWRFEDGDKPAEQSDVKALLAAINDLEAVAFVDGVTGAGAEYGLDSPQVVFRLTVPGSEQVERIAVGDYTDKAAQRLVYVRWNDGVSIAKVRVAEVGLLLQDPAGLRDRRIFDVAETRVTELTISTRSPCAEGRMTAKFGRPDDVWTMLDPATDAVRSDGLDKLVETLAGLTAKRVVAEQGEPSAYGLHDPAVTIAFTYEPPPTIRLEPAPVEETDSDDDASKSTTETDDDASDSTTETDDDASKSQTQSDDAEGSEKPPRKLVPVTVHPPAEEYRVSLTDHDGVVYAMRSDQPTVYRLDRPVYDTLLTEYRSDTVLEFDDASVSRFSIQTGGKTHSFERSQDPAGARWTYSALPDLPLDNDKVKNLLAQLADLRTSRYAVYKVDDLGAFGLTTPAHIVVVDNEDGSQATLRVSSTACARDPDAGRYATVEGRPGVFLLTDDMIARFAVSLDELEAAR